MCFLEPLVIACTVYDILAQIDHKIKVQIGPLWPWKWPLDWFHTIHILGKV